MYSFYYASFGHSIYVSKPTQFLDFMLCGLPPLPIQLEEAEREEEDDDDSDLNNHHPCVCYLQY